MTTPDPTPVSAWLSELQALICTALEDIDGDARFVEDPADYPRGGVSRPRILSGGRHIEKAAVNFTRASGAQLPPAATKQRPHLAGRSFTATSLSLIVHPRNPYAPTSHANWRFFIAHGETPSWWFGGGLDLTPCYGFDEDCRHWHRTAAAACEPFGQDIYPQLKQACDDYFFLPHRQEARGIGGLFFDDWTQGGFAQSFAFVRSMGRHFLKAYIPILERRVTMSYGEQQRAFQRYRRGRYVEFNLLYDRGTRYGLQSGRRIEAVMASMPPQVAWPYKWHAAPGSPEAELVSRYLTPRDWR